MLAGWLYPPLQWLQRITVRRDVLAEMRRQRAFRKQPIAEQWSWSFARAVDFAHHMAKLSPAYGKLLAERGVTLPGRMTLDEWQALPVVSKADFRRESDAWYGQTGDAHEWTWCWTSGSTGEPFKFPHTTHSQLCEVVRNELSLLTVGFKPHYPSATIKVEIKKPTGFRKVIRALMGNTPVGFAAAEFKRENVPHMVEELRRAGIKFLRGYSTSIYLLADEMLARGLHVHVPIISTFGEGCSPAQAEIIEKAFSGKVYRDYGGSEAMHMAFEGPSQNGYHVDLSRFYVEILRDGRPVKPGEAGEIVVTGFTNDAMPLVRYRMGDIGIWAEPRNTVPGEENTPIIASISGRSADTVFTSTGHLINVPLLVVVFEYAQEHISQFKVIQTAPDVFDVQWVARHDRAAEHVAKLNEELVEKTGGATKFTWYQVPEIAPEPSGKRRILVPLS
ncbi:MAG: phenylacetate--CoA ligase family protein [Calditrichaeota bacterium]|nr:phenylacetate--CoA ligase family protein [Calditrichota bacterium]